MYETRFCNKRWNPVFSLHTFYLMKPHLLLYFPDKRALRFWKSCDCFSGIEIHSKTCNIIVHFFRGNSWPIVTPCYGHEKSMYLKKFEQVLMWIFFCTLSHVFEFIQYNIVCTNNQGIVQMFGLIFTLKLKRWHIFKWYLSLLFINIFFNVVIVCLKLKMLHFYYNFTSAKLV